MLYFDIDQRALIRAPGSDQMISSERGKRGDTLPLSVTILRGGAVESLTSVTEMVFAVKLAVDGADPLILANAFTEASGVWTSALTMDTEGLDEALGAADKIDLLAEFTFTSSLGTISSQVITFALYKDLWLGSEGTPLSLPTPAEWLALQNAAIRAALGIPTYANLAAANVALTIGRIYYDEALETLNTATA